MCCLIYNFFFFLSVSFVRVNVANYNEYSDNRLVSKTDTIKELKLAIDAFDLSPAQVREIVINGFKRSFFHGPYVHRREYVRRAVAHYDQVAAKHGMVASSES